MKTLFWYCFVFIGEDKSGNRNVTASVYRGLKSKKITIDNVSEAMKSADMKKDSVKIGLMYHGRMTFKQFTGDNNVS